MISLGPNALGFATFSVGGEAARKRLFAQTLAKKNREKPWDNVGLEFERV